MLPHKHFLISGFLIAILAIVLRLDAITILLWVLVGGLISALIDIDSIILLTLTKNKRLARFKSLKEIFLNFNGLIYTFRKTGALRILSITHLMISIAIVIVTIFFFGDWLVPVVAGIVPHLITDILLFTGE